VSSYGGDLIRESRRRAGLTQAELAERAGTAQPAIARWESGRTAVSLDDVIRLIRLCGLDVEFQIVERDDSDIAQATRLARLSGQQRLDRHTRLARQLKGLRAAGSRT
jgi:transcriptional regulator with XRE-family HTH domain